MTREQALAEIGQMFGLVPTFIKSVPADTLGMEWELMKRAQFEEGAVPNKYRELIGLGIAAVSKCKYCAYFHTVAAKLNGATDEEIADTLRYAKSSAGWSAWLNGGQFDYQQFKLEMDQVAAHIRNSASAQAG